LPFYTITNINYDIVTDHELHQEGVAATIAGYRTLITGSHPEYHTLESLNVLQSFRDDYGGNLIYLGGDGFYWRIAAEVPTPEDSTSLLEISTRRKMGFVLGPPNQENIIMSLAIAPLLHTEGFGGVWIVHRNDVWE
jgi:hypothetical protein